MLDPGEVQGLVDLCHVQLAATAALARELARAGVIDVRGVDVTFRAAREMYPATKAGALFDTFLTLLGTHRPSDPSPERGSKPGFVPRLVRTDPDESGE